MRTNTTFNRVRNATLLGIAGVGAAGAIAFGPATAAHAGPNLPADVAAPAAAAQSDLDVNGALQPNGYYCGPAATRIALSAHGTPPGFDELAQQMGTTKAGTQSI